MISRKLQIFKDAGFYLTGSFAAQFLDMINGVLMRRFLGPTQMGVWSFLQVILSYAKHSTFGIGMATARDIPYFRAKGEHAKAEEIKNLVFSFTFLTSGLTAAGVAIFALCKHSSYSRPIFYGLIFTAALIIIQRIYNMFVVNIRANKEFGIASGLNVFSSLMSILFTVTLAWKWGLYGLFTGVLLNYLLSIAVILWKTRHRFKFQFSWKPLKPILGLGFAMLVYDACTTLFASADKVMITKFLGFKELGYYSVALMANNYLCSIPNMLNIIFFPHFQEIFAKEDRREDLKSFLIKPTLSLSFVLPFAIAFVCFFSAWLVPLFLPKFTTGLSSLKYLALSAFFMGLTQHFNSFLITIKRQWLLIAVQAASALSAFGITWIFIRAGGGITGVACADIVIMALNFAGMSWVSLKGMKSGRELFTYYFKVFFTFLYSAAAILLLDHWLIAWLKPGFLTACLQSLAFFMMMIPFLIAAEKESGFLSTAWQTLQTLGKKKPAAAAL